jgi:hypothetical protein
MRAASASLVGVADLVVDIGEPPLLLEAACRLVVGSPIVLFRVLPRARRWVSVAALAKSGQPQLLSVAGYSLSRFVGFLRRLSEVGFGDVGSLARRCGRLLYQPRDIGLDARQIGALAKLLMATRWRLSLSLSGPTLPALEVRK